MCSPFFGDLIVDSPTKTPHPPSGPRTMTSQAILRRCAAVKKAQVRKEIVGLMDTFGLAILSALDVRKFIVTVRT